MTIDDILAQLDENSQFLDFVQNRLREFVLDRSNILDIRFSVWTMHCKKEDHPWRLHSGDQGVIGSMVNDLWPYEYDRYRTYGWRFFLDQVQDHWVSPKSRPSRKLAFEMPTVDEFKELLIQTNFGSMLYD